MSWGLFNHNVPYQPSGLVPPNVGEEIDATTIFTGVPNFAGRPEGMFAVAPGGRIMALPEGKTTNVATTPVMYSDDGGDTWTETGVIPVSPTAGDRLVTRLIYSSFHDGWFFVSQTGINNSGEVYYSLNNGASWTAMGFAGDNNHPFGAANRNIQLDSLGALYVVGRLGSPNEVAVHRYPNPLAGKGTYTRSATISNSNTSDLHWIGDNLTMKIRVVSGVVTERIYWINKDFESGDPINYIGDIGGDNHPIYPHVSDKTALTLAFADSNTSSNTATSYYPVTVDTVAPLAAVNLTTSVSCSKPYAPGYGIDHFLFGHRPSETLNKYLLSHSFDGATWSPEITLNLDASREGDNTLLRHMSGSTWLLGIISGGKMRILRFDYGQRSNISPANGPLSREIRKQSPDIFLKLDDTGSPSSVTDIGRKGYANAVSQTVTFGEAGLVPDNGTAALFGDGSITVNVTAGAYQHAHLLILSHDDTASERTLLSFNGFTLKLAADDTVVFSDGDKTLASAAVAADTATLVALSLEKIACGTKANLYVGATHVGQELSSLEPASAGDLVLGGNGVTIDYYAMIPSSSADVAALQRAFGLSPSLPNAPTSALCGDVKLLVRADDAPVLQQVKPPSLGYWIDAYTIKNIATGERDIYWWKDGGGSVHQAAGGKFDGGLYVPDISPGSASRYPQSEPAWLGYADLELGTRDFSLSAWVKPGSNGFFHLGISTRYKIQSGFSIPYGGFAFTVFITPAGPGSWVTVGQPLGAYGPGSPVSQSFALQEEFSPFPSYTPNDWNFVTLCRKAGRFYVTVNGRLPGNRSIRYGRQGVPIVSPGAGAELCMGWNEATNRSGRWGESRSEDPSGGTKRLSRLAYRGTFDDLVLVIDEALYTQEFTPPNSRFELS